MLPVSRNQRGFTFIELLATITIIGLLATIGTVSYEGARKYARDIKRISDMNAVQTALELYFDSHLSYPYDGGPGSAGVILGTQGKSLSDDGFTAIAQGLLYLLNVPANPEPNGIPYIYRSVNADGSDCDKAPCPRYEIIFATEGEIAGLKPGVHVLSQSGVEREPSAPEGTLPQISGDYATIALGGLNQAVFFFKQNTSDALNNPAVKTGAEAIVAPVATAGLIGALATAAPLAQLPRYLLFFFSQPFLFFTRRRKEGFGVVYDALSKLPVDLAIVRVRDIKRGAVVRSSVTDSRGRFNFLLAAGDYRLEVAKPGYLFPSLALKVEKQDGDFLDLYHGETFNITEKETALVRNVPLDPVRDDVEDKVLVRRAASRKFREAVALSGPVLAVVSFVVVPSLAMGALLFFHLGLYYFFRKISAPTRGRDAGVVFDEYDKKPIPRAILRMFALPYHKLVATTVTDARGRYNFLVGPAEIYLTVTKEGYVKTETEIVDLKDQHGAITIASDLPLRRLGKNNEAEPVGDRDHGT